MKAYGGFSSNWHLRGLGVQQLIPSWGLGGGFKGALTEDGLAANPYVRAPIPGAMYSSTTLYGGASVYLTMAPGEHLNYTRVALGSVAVDLSAEHASVGIVWPPQITIEGMTIENP